MITYKTGNFTHQITKFLLNHTSPETAYVVEDYPYGFRLRCKIRYWLEFKKNQGFRLVSQTTNPKQSGEVWNKPKSSTYCKYGAAMYLDEQNHVTWAGLSEYSDLQEAIKWVQTFGEAVPAIGLPNLKAFLVKICAYEKAKQESKVSWVINGVKQSPEQSKYTPEEFKMMFEFVKAFVQTGTTHE